MFCHRCGMEATEKAKFCSQCGTELLEAKKDPAEESGLLTAKEAAEYLRIGYQILVRLARRGDIKSFRPCRKYLFRREDLDAFIVSHLRWSPVEAVSVLEDAAEELLRKHRHTRLIQ